MFSKENKACAIMFSMDNFGKWLLDILEEKKLSQSELARMAGISRGTLSNIISGARGRGHESLRAIAKALKLPPEQVYRAAGLLPPSVEKDEWVEEMDHKIKLIPPRLRGIVGNFIDTVLQDEEAEQRSKPKPKTAKV